MSFEPVPSLSTAVSQLLCCPTVLSWILGVMVNELDHFCSRFITEGGILKPLAVNMSINLGPQTLKIIDLSQKVHFCDFITLAIYFFPNTRILYPWFNLTDIVARTIFSYIFFSLPLCRSVIRTHDSRVAPYWDLMDVLPTVAAVPCWYRGYTFTLCNYKPASVLTWFIYFFLSVKPLSTNFFCWQLMLAKQ